MDIRFIAYLTDGLDVRVGDVTLSVSWIYIGTEPASQTATK